MRKRTPLYIETTIRCELPILWAYTQDPALHQQWDLRFSEISYLPKEGTDAPQQFLYSTRIGFGIRVSGVGESVATKTKSNSESTSVLKFSSADRLSVIRQGSGYWKYIPGPGGIRFFTGYDYDTRWGLFGKLFDRFLFRPMMIRATAWSFDCLKNWIEQGLHPRQAVRAQLAVIVSAAATGLVWIYQGLVPKLLYTDTGELELLRQSGSFSGHEKDVLTAIGFAEILFGLMLLFVHKRAIHLINIAVLLGLSITVIFSDPAIYTLPFNPFSLNLSLVALSAITLFHIGDLPRAAHCITRQHP